MTKLHLYLKKPHIDIVSVLKEKYKFRCNESVIKHCIDSAIIIKNYELIFGELHEKCSGGCYAAKPVLELNLDKNILKQLKQFHTNYNFDEYATDDQKVSKVIRCIINFYEQEPLF